jgi:hypothetical protein
MDKERLLSIEKPPGFQNGATRVKQIITLIRDGNLQISKSFHFQIFNHLPGVMMNIHHDFTEAMKGKLSDRDFKQRHPADPDQRFGGVRCQGHQACAKTGCEDQGFQSGSDLFRFAQMFLLRRLRTACFALVFSFFAKFGGDCFLFVFFAEFFSHFTSLLYLLPMIKDATEFIIVPIFETVAVSKV